MAGGQELNAKGLQGSGVMGAIRRHLMNQAASGRPKGGSWRRALMMHRALTLIRPARAARGAAPTCGACLWVGRVVPNPPLARSRIVSRLRGAALSANGRLVEPSLPD